MSRRTLPLAIMLGILLPLAAADVVAQTNQELVADIPFNFIVCDEQLPAGQYKVRPLSGANPRIMLMKGTDNRAAIMACAHDVQVPKRSTGAKLIFNQYGDRYFLSELWLQGEVTGVELFKSAQEEALIRETMEVNKRGKVTIRATESKP